IILCPLHVRPILEAQCQSGSLQKVTLGDTLHVSCQVYTGQRTLVWYKLDSSRKLQLLVSVNTHEGQSIYSDNRYSFQSSESCDILSVSNVTWVDEGTYFCGVMNKNDVRFEPGTVVEIEGQSRPLQSVLQRPVYIRAQPGDSVTLSCSFNISHCPKEHTSVTWRKNNLAFRMISWTSGNDDITCQNRVNHREASCVHNLILKNASSSEDGTYLCVVTACGDTLLGTGTRIHLFNDTLLEVFGPSFTVMALSGLSVVLGVTVAVLLGVMCRKRRTNARGMRFTLPEDLHEAKSRSPIEEPVVYSQVEIRQKD
uniref:Ig-like domain-containing protein n=1 Tax=Neogobius melanostomus TaxID=47308 RepID=A0A8C6SXD8_9GOBI